MVTGVLFKKTSPEVDVLGETFRFNGIMPPSPIVSSAATPAFDSMELL